MSGNRDAGAALLERIGWHVRNALLGEVYATPKPGLVDRRDTGAHRDMDYETFLRSTEAITPYLVEMFAAGWKGHAEGEQPDAVFQTIRRIGQEAETAMYQATAGVNTHKGMIFTMGIVLAATGMLYAQPERSTDAILHETQQMTARSLAEDFQQMLTHAPRTHGEQLFHDTGERGIRGQAMEGFPILRDTALPWLRRFLHIQEDTVLQAAFSRQATLRQDLLQDEGHMHREHFENAVHVSTLIAIMSVLNDTNVLIRSSYPDLCWLQSESSSILSKGAMFTEEGVHAIEALNARCIEKNISPGGAADILAVAILLERLVEDHAAAMAPSCGSEEMSCTTSSGPSWIAVSR